MYLVEISRSGMKNCCAYCMKATSVPIVIAWRITLPPPIHRITAIVIELSASTDENSAVS